MTATDIAVAAFFVGVVPWTLFVTVPLLKRDRFALMVLATMVYSIGGGIAVTAISGAL